MRLSEQTGKVVLLVGFIMGGIAGTKSYAQQAQRLNNGTLIIDNFQEDTVGHLPAGWYDRNGDHKVTQLDGKEQAKYHYKIMKSNENRFLRYEGMDAMHLNFPLINRHHKNIYDINVYKTPVLSWKWRVFNLPDGADIDEKDKNDAAASIYIVWGFGHVLFKKVPKTVRYVWGNTQPAGTELSEFFGNQKIIVLKSGPKGKGKWVKFQRNIVKDYKRLFGDKPPKSPLAILILSDGDSTHSHVKADYDDIKLKPVKNSRE